MMRLLVALLAGALFGAGLALARMTEPAVVLAFLDIAGDWNPSLALVMALAAGTMAIAYRLALARGRPWFAPGFSLPEAVKVDRPLLQGAVLFGIGWGLAGYCPGPAVAALAAGVESAFWFVPAMLAGGLLQAWVSGSRR